MIFRTAIASLVLATACSRSAPPAPKYATGPTPDEFSEYELPDDCTSLLERVNSKGPERLRAWVELSTCLAKSAIALSDLDDSAESVTLLEEMTAPSFVLLDHALGTDQMPIKIAALQAKAALYSEMRAQMLATVVKPAGTKADAWRQYAARRERIETMIEPWNERALATHRRIVALGDAHPELSTNAEVQLAIRSSEKKLAAAIATRD